LRKTITSASGHSDSRAGPEWGMDAERVIGLVWSGEGVSYQMLHMRGIR
jgi:hypothetical protein